MKPGDIIKLCSHDVLLTVIGVEPVSGEATLFFVNTAEHGQIVVETKSFGIASALSAKACEVQNKLSFECDRELSPRFTSAAPM